MDQFEAFNSHWSENLDYAGGKGNNRAVQPTHFRTIQRSKYDPKNVQSNEFLDTFVVSSDLMSKREQSLLSYLAEGLVEATKITLSQFQNGVTTLFGFNKNQQSDEKPVQIS